MSSGPSLSCPLSLYLPTPHVLLCWLQRRDSTHSSSSLLPKAKKGHAPLTGPAGTVAGQSPVAPEDGSLVHTGSPTSVGPSVPGGGE